MATETKLIFTVTNDLNYDQRMHRICGSLARHGYKVTLVGRLKPSSSGLAEKPFFQERLRCFFQKGKLFYLEFNLRLLFYLLQNASDGLGPVDLDTIAPCRLAAKWKKVPCIQDSHEYFAEVPEVIKRPLVKSVWEQVAKRLLPKMDLCYTVSESLAQVFQEKYGKQFHVIRNVPWLGNHPTEAINSADSEQFILYQGALNDGRGLEILIDAMQSINMSLYLAGEGDLSQKLRSYVLEKGVEDKVHFLGFISPEKLKALTPKAFLGFNVLENKGLNYYYSLPNKFFDYLHAGVPVLTNNFPEYRKINDRYKVALLLNLNKEAIIEAISYLQNNPDCYRDLVDSCLEARETFNWDQEEKHLVDLYENIFG